MKKLVVTTLALVACVSAFAQGKVSFGNDSNHLVTLFNDPARLPAAWNSLAGLAVPQTGGANAQNMGLLTAELWAGSSAGSLAMVNSSAGAGQAGFADGRLANRNVTLAGLAGGTPAFFQVRIYETAAGSFANAQGGNFLSGESPVFTAVPGAILPNSIVLPGAPSNSTWANGPIVLQAAPEPSSFAFLGLGAAAMMILRRRK